MSGIFDIDMCFYNILTFTILCHKSCSVIFPVHWTCWTWNKCNTSSTQEIAVFRMQSTHSPSPTSHRSRQMQMYLQYCHHFIVYSSLTASRQEIIEETRAKLARGEVNQTDKVRSYVGTISNDSCCLLVVGPRLNLQT